ncbi:MAG: histidine kinase, partial [Candidatus Eisenbacteria bacterium]|nr:histidine kinase [Candidatus Eisenbacteria bacterium]
MSERRSTPPAETDYRIPRRTAFAIGWGVFALFYTLQSYTFHLSVGQSAAWGPFLANEALFVGLLAVQTPLILHLAGRYPIAGRRRGRHLALHVAAALVFGFAHRFVVELITRSLRATPERPFVWPHVWQSTIGSFEIGVFAYFVVLLAAAFWDSYGRYQAERLQAAHLRADLSAAQLETLRMQVQPHFLFNTLNAISVLIDQDPAAARTMIASLSDFLRATLTEGGRQEIPLAREVELLRTYLKIEQTRFGERLEVRFRIADDAESIAVPALVLQPLVENAIRHGISRRTGRSRIEIEATLADGALLLAVRDQALPDPGVAALPDPTAAASPIPRDAAPAPTRASAPATSGDVPGLGIGLGNTQAR